MGTDSIRPHLLDEQMLDRPTTEGTAEPWDLYAHFELALASADAMTWMWDIASDRLSWAGRTKDFLFGVPDDVSSLSGAEFASKVYVEDREAFARETMAIAHSGGEYVQAYRARRADGDLRWFESRGRAIRDQHGWALRLLGVVQDVTERRRMEEALRESEQRLKSVLTGAPLAIVAFDHDGVITLAQGSALDTMHVDGDTLVGSAVGRFLEESPEALTDVERTLAGEVVDARLELSGLTFDTSYRPLTGPEDEMVGAVIVATDVTEKVRAEEQLARMALHDPLTDLANRVLFNSRLELHLARSARRHGHTTVLFLDLDRFKLVNDTHGHEVGDDLLRAVADRLRASVRPEDTVARFGGDEFLVLSEVADVAEAEVIAGRVLAAVSRPLTLGALTLEVGVSIGAAIAGPTAEVEVAEVATSLIRRADTAMYQAKQAGRGRYVVVSDPPAPPTGDGRPVHASGSQRVDVEEAGRVAIVGGKMTGTWADGAPEPD